MVSGSTPRRSTGGSGSWANCPSTGRAAVCSGSGLNDNHPVVRARYAAIDGVLRPIVAAEERRARSHLVRAGGALRARDQVGLRALNDALKGAFDAPGKAGFEPGGTPTKQAPLVREELERDQRERPGQSSELAAPEPAAPLRFKQALLRLHPGERRGISLLIDPRGSHPERRSTSSSTRRSASTSGPTPSHSPCAAAGHACRHTCAAASAPTRERGSASSPTPADTSPS
jgi:hypothetical protein